MSPDPKFKIQPDQSPYKSFLNNPIIYEDPEGETEVLTINYHNKQTGERSQLVIHMSDNVQVSMNYSSGMPEWRDIDLTINVVIDANGQTSVTNYFNENGKIRGSWFVYDRSDFQTDKRWTTDGGYRFISAKGEAVVYQIRLRFM